MAFLQDLIQISYWLSLLTLPLGLAGNTLTFIIYSRPSLRKLTISLYFRVVSLVDLFITLNWVKVFFRDKFNLYLNRQSTLMCKLTEFSIFSAGPISSWIEVLISFDRLLKITSPNRYHKLIEGLKCQIGLLIFVFVGNMAYYSYRLVDDELVVVVKNETTMTMSCELVRNVNGEFWMEMGNVLAPFGAMSVSSAITIGFIARSRKRMQLNHHQSSSMAKTSGQNNHREQKHHIRDVKFAVTSISLNLFFLLSNLPIPFYNLILKNITFIDSDLNDFLDTVFTFLWYTYFMFSFYLQLAVNSLVRAEFFQMLGRQNNDNLVASTGGGGGGGIGSIRSFFHLN
jgi:hypothetical protein